jgi:biotin carboxyl carrier protein
MASCRPGARHDPVAVVSPNRLPPRRTLIAGPTGEPGWPDVAIHERAVRVRIAGASRLEGDASLRISPAPDPAARLPGVGATMPALPLVDGVPATIRLERFGEVRARLVEAGADDGGPERRTDVLFGPVWVDRAHGTRHREVIVNGWRIEVEIESERYAALRERARRGAGAVSLGGPIEVRAIIPGRIVAISVRAGDRVEAGQQILVVEAMKMQNELRAPREGAVDRVGVAVGDTIDVGDLLVVIH